MQFPCVECAWRHSSLLLENKKNLIEQWILLDPYHLHFDCVCFHSFLAGTIPPLQCISWWGVQVQMYFPRKPQACQAAAKGHVVVPDCVALRILSGRSSCRFAWVVPGGSPCTSEAVLVSNTTSSLQRIMDIFVFLTSYFLWLGRAMLSYISNVPKLLVEFLAICFSRGDLTALDLSQVSLFSVASFMEC